MANKVISDEYLAAAFLIDPERGASRLLEIDFDLIDTEKLLGIVKHNKLPLATLYREAKAACSDLLSRPEIEKEWEIEERILSEQRDDWIKVRNAYLQVGIESMLIKSTGFFPYKSSNLDVLIKQEKRSTAEAILRGMGYIQLHNVEEPYKTLFRSFSGGEPKSVIHLHNKVAWMNPFHDEELLWSRYRQSKEDDQVDIPSPEDSILILTAHWFYEDKEIKLCDVMNIARCLREPNLNWEYIKRVAKRLGWLDGLHFALLVESSVERSIYRSSLISQALQDEMRGALPGWMRRYLDKRFGTEETKLPLTFSKMFGKSLHLVKTTRDETTTFLGKLHELYVVMHGALLVVLFEKGGINIRHQVPMLISISGVDGSGKTLYAEKLYEILGICELRRTLIWSRVGSSNLLKPFAKMGKWLYMVGKSWNTSVSSGDYGDEDKKRKDLFKKSRAAKVIGLLFLLLEMGWIYRVKIGIALLLKKAVICDRYVYDTLADLEARYGVKTEDRLGKIFGTLFRALAPKEDMAYLLFISFDEAFKRKTIQPREEETVREQVAAYRRLREAFDLYEINTQERDKENITQMIISQTLKRYYGKWEKVQ